MAGAFVRHRGLIAFAAGGAMTEMAGDSQRGLRDVAQVIAAAAAAWRMPDLDQACPSS